MKKSKSKYFIESNIHQLIWNHEYLFEKYILEQTIIFYLNFKNYDMFFTDGTYQKLNIYCYIKNLNIALKFNRKKII
jgi:hypothetical protein